MLTAYKAYQKMVAGDTLMLMDGTHTVAQSSAAFILLNTSKGTAANPITIRAENYGMAVIDGAYACGIGFQLSGSASYVNIEGIEFKRFITWGIGGSGISETSVVRNIRIYKCKIHDIGNYRTMNCTQAWGLAGVFSNMFTYGWTVDSCIIHTVGRLEGGCEEHDYKHDHGWYAQGYGHILQNSFVYNMYAGWGLKIDGYCLLTGLPSPVGTPTMTVRHNSFSYGTNPSNSGHITHYSNPSTTCNGKTTRILYPHDTLIHSNAFHNTAVGTKNAAVLTAGITEYKGITIKNNVMDTPNIWAIYLETGGTGSVLTSGNVVSHPNASFFVDVSNMSNPDFTPQSTFIGIDMGFASDLSLDYTGTTSRPQGSGYDVGAYEIAFEAEPPASPYKFYIGTGATGLFGQGALTDLR